MANDLSAPLGRKRKKPASPLPLPTRSRLPLARIAFAVIGLAIIGIVLRIVLVNDPAGGRPSVEIAVNSTRNANPVVGTVGGESSSMATITAEAEISATDPSGPSVMTVDPNLPDSDTTPAGGSTPADKDGLYPDLMEQTDHGAIPRVAANGTTPFDAYARPSITADTAAGKALIAIVVTGLGLNNAGTLAAIDKLPDAVTLAFAPYGKTLSTTVAAARGAGHELLLEVPLEPFDYPDNDPGPDTLLTGQTARANLDKLFNVMGKFGGYVGLINHMGARFTASSADFSPMMEELGSRGLGYVDDGSSNRSVAPQLAAANSVEFGRADLALDANPARAPILAQLQALEDKALKQGSAIGVISALPVSVDTLTEWAKGLEDRGFTIVPVSALMKKTS